MRAGHILGILLICSPDPARAQDKQKTDSWFVLIMDGIVNHNKKSIDKTSSTANEAPVVTTTILCLNPQERGCQPTKPDRPAFH